MTEPQQVYVIKLCILGREIYLDNLATVDMVRSTDPQCFCGNVKRARHFLADWLARQELEFVKQHYPEATVGRVVL